MELERIGKGSVNVKVINESNLWTVIIILVLLILFVCQLCPLSVHLICFHDQQIDYAATDAAVALHILQALVEIKLTRHDRRESVAGLTRYANEIAEPTRTHSEPHLSRIANQNRPLSSHDHQHSNLIGRSIEAWLSDEERLTCLSSLCQGVVDVLFKQRRSSKTLPPLLEGESPTGSRKTSAYSVRKSRLYHNCRLLAPDGQLLSTMQKKKLEWYLERDLGSKYHGPAGPVLHPWKHTQTHIHTHTHTNAYTHTNA